MKMYLPFGDWSDDGHGKWDKVFNGASTQRTEED